MFDVAYEIVTDESAEHGEAETHGLIGTFSLRVAISELFATRTCHVGGIVAIETSDSDIGQARWISVYNAREFLTGAQESRSLHFPETLTASSRRRLVRLLKGQ